MAPAFRIVLALAALASAKPALAEDAVILDYRDKDFLLGQAFYDARERARVAKALEADAGLAKAMGPNFALLGDAEGAFTRPGAEERVYLVQSRAAIALEPFPDEPAPVLVVLAKGEPAALARLEKPDLYQRLVAAADADGDGIDEVLLESVFMNMGEAVTSLTAVKLGANGTKATRAQTLEAVLDDSCELEGSARALSASTIAIGADGAFHAEPHKLDCPD